MNESDKVKVVYILGRAHCGSTVLGGLLDQFEDVFAAGELGVIAREQELADVLQCSCGASVMDCPLWKDVRENYKDAGNGFSWEQHAKTLCSTDTLSAGWPVMWGGRTDRLTRFVEEKKRLYEIISERTGVRVVVDTGRNPFLAAQLLRSMPHCRVIHLVRNGEDFLYSKLHRIESGKGFKWYRFHWKKARGKGLFMFLGSWSWFLGNLLCDWVRSRYPDRVTRIRYEDLCADPAGELRMLGERLGADPAEAIRKVEGGEPLTIEHMYNGNPLARSGPFVFKPDTGKPLPAGYRMLFRVIAWPLMWKYGYFRSGGGKGGAS